MVRDITKYSQWETPYKEILCVRKALAGGKLVPLLRGSVVSTCLTQRVQQNRFV